MQDNIVSITPGFHYPYDYDFLPADRHRPPESVITIISDSLSLPRIAHGLPKEATYPYLLRNILNSHKVNSDLHLLARTAKTISQAILDVEYARQIGTRKLVVHVGIVDCFPRILSRKMTEALAEEDVHVQTILRNFFSQRRAEIIRSIPLKSYTPPAEFMARAHELVSLAGNHSMDVFFIGIIDPSPGQLSRTPYLDNQVTLYNNILEQTCRDTTATFINTNLLLNKFKLSPQTILLPNDEHLNNKGCRTLATILARYFI